MGFLVPDVPGEIAMRSARRAVTGYTEVARFWSGPPKAKPVLLVNTAAVATPADFGAIVADGFAQAAKAFAAAGGITEAQALDKILTGFDGRRKSMRDSS